MRIEPAARHSLAVLLAISLAAAMALSFGAKAAEGPPEAAQAKTVPLLPAIDPDEDTLLSLLPPGAELRSTGDADEDATLAAVRDIKARGILAVRDDQAALQKVLADMPKPFTRLSTVAGVVNYRGDSRDDCVAFARNTRTRTFVCRGNPYPSAALYLGSFFNEINQSDQALAALDIGLLAAPGSPGLISERGAALMNLHRWPEALANYDRGLKLENLAPEDRARLYRGRGNCLTETNQLDAAEAAYRASLQLAPDNALAKNELIYIAGLRAGAAPTASSLTSVQPAGK